jgi:4,5-dihydroxyphthalate decarboxylase
MRRCRQAAKGAIAMADLELTLACWDYDITRPLRDGTVRPEGVNLTYLSVFPAENFQRNLQFNEFDVAEMGLKFYVSTLGLENPPYIAIPVFPVRLFRHSAIYVHCASGIRTPRDLIGKKVGEPFAYGHDGAIWPRGILSDEYGVPVNSVTYYVGAVDKTLRRDFAPFLPHNGIRVEQIRPDQTLDAMLESGEIDAFYSGIVPPSLLRGSTKIGRLFEDYRSVERAYFTKTGIFPIMHTIAIRRDLYEKHRWLAQSLYKAFREAKAQAMAFYQRRAINFHITYGFPWASALFDDVRETMGEDWWPYGIERNRKTIETFLRYHEEQGLSKRRITMEEMFAPETSVDYPLLP